MQRTQKVHISIQAHSQHLCTHTHTHTPTHTHAHTHTHTHTHTHRHTHNSNTQHTQHNTYVHAYRQLSLAVQMLDLLSQLSDELQQFAQRHILEKQQALDQVRSGGEAGRVCCCVHAGLELVLGAGSGEAASGGPGQWRRGRQGVLLCAYWSPVSVPKEPVIEMCDGEAGSAKAIPLRKTSRASQHKIGCFWYKARAALHPAHHMLLRKHCVVKEAMRLIS